MGQCHNDAFFIPVPPEAPSKFTVIAQSSTSVETSWELLTLHSNKRIIVGFKLIYRKEDSNDSAIILTINSAAVFTTNVTGLEKYTKYEFQVLAFSSAGDGPTSSVQVERTMEDGKGLTSSVN